MREKNQINLTAYINEKWNQYKFEILTCLIVAFAAYMFAFTNKIPNWDDTQYLFSKGASLSSGRWGLDILGKILPNYSIPWLWGWISVCLLTVSACMILDIFQIRDKVLRCVLAGVIISFPSEIGTMLYMFTSSSYAIAFCCTVIGVRLMQYDSINCKLASVGLTVLSLSIYQAYIAITASFFVLQMMQMLLHGEKLEKVIRRGVVFLLFLVVTLLVYCGITFALLWMDGSELNSWAVRATTVSGGIIYRVMRTWKLFAAMVVYRDYGLITSSYSWFAHIVCLGITAVVAVVQVFKRKKLADAALLCFLGGFLFPLSINALVLLIGENGVHALTLYSFISVYLFMAVVCETIKEKGAVREIALCGLTVVLLSNIYAANKAYFKQYMVYENTFSFYNSIVTQIQMTPGFDEESKIAFVGNISKDSEYLSNFGKEPIYGLNGFKASAISENFISHYLGTDFQYASNDEIVQIVNSELFSDMPTYPYYGYIQKFDNIIVIKIGE